MRARDGGPRSRSSAEGALALLAHAVTVRRQPRVALAALSRALARARVLAGPRGAADEVATGLLEKLGKRGKHADE